MSIADLGTVSHIPEAVIAAADTIKLLNYKTTTPAKFRKNELTEELAGPMLDELADIIGVPKDRLDYVYFSCCRGAEPHTDQLPRERFGPMTYIIPVILPKFGSALITAGIVSKVVEVGGVYMFNHEQIHSMTLEDNESGCVVIMVAVKHPGVH
jgi:hypothetical protein